MKYDFNIDTYIAFLTANGNRYSGVEASKAIGFPASSLDWTHARVRKAWLRGFGFVVVARIVFQNGDIRYVCTNDLSLTDYADVSRESKKRWTIEEFHRGIKQTTGIEKCYSVKKRSQLTHIFACFVAFVRLEVGRLKTGLSWYEQKAQLFCPRRIHISPTRDHSPTSKHPPNSVTLTRQNSIFATTPAR